MTSRGSSNNNRVSGVNGIPPEGLRPIVKQSLQNQLFKNCGSKWNGDMVLIVDDASTRIISKAMGMYDLMENRVYLVETLKLKRAPYRQSAPIYFLSPTLDSVNRLIEDWTPSHSPSKRTEPLYADTVFLFFTKSLSDELFMKIKACKPLIRRLKVFSEINIDFIAHENRAFHFDMSSNEVFRNLFQITNGSGSVGNGHGNGHSPAEVEMADKLVTVCASLNEYPHIRYKASSKVASSLAQLFNNKFNTFVGKNKNWWYHGDANHTERGRSTLLLLSRQDDCLTPLLHEFTYQAMVYDLLEIDDEKITVEVPIEDEMEKKDMLLNENDELWVELRGQHIAEVIKVLSARIRDIVHSNSGVQELNKKEGKALSMSQMTNALKNLPEYREVLSKLSHHMNIAHRCMGIFNSTGLMDLSDLEQTLANGTNESGKGVNVTQMVDMVEELLQRTNESLSRFRLIAIFIISQKGLRATDKDRLFAAARLNPEEAKALSNLESLGHPLIQAPNTSRIQLGNDKLVRRSVDADSDIEYSTSRYACDLKGLLKQSQMKKLSFTDYPSIYPMPDEGNSSSIATSGVSSLRTGGSRYSANRRTNVGAPKTRMIVFVAGGACYSELRAAQEIMEKGGQEIILGSTHIMNPTEFVENLTSL